MTGEMAFDFTGGVPAEETMFRLDQLLDLFGRLASVDGAGRNARFPRDGPSAFSALPLALRDTIPVLVDRLDLALAQRFAHGHLSSTRSFALAARLVWYCMFCGASIPQQASGMM
jgi:hypothetical protein